MSEEEARCVDAGHPAEAGEGRDLAEEVETDDGVREREHQEVDPGGSGGQHTEHQCDRRGDDQGDRDREPRMPSQFETAAALGDHVADDEPGNTEDQPLAQ